jgi:ubiquinone/menaquinone biosynthesis C-methylase UbiE
MHTPTQLVWRGYDTDTLNAGNPDKNAHKGGRPESETMKRVLEPELMDDELQSVAYAKADFSTSNQFFVDTVVRDLPSHLRNVVDIGCGPGDVDVRLARAAPGIHITAIDGSAPMIALARDAVRAAGLDTRVTVVQAHIPGAPLREHSYDAILSKDLLHHLPDPSVLWREASRLARTGAAVAVMDLIRPANPADARRIVDTVAAREDPILREDFYNSLCAAFTIDELHDQLSTAGLTFEVMKVSERHMLIRGFLL